jgi:hypothetical protein
MLIDPTEHDQQFVRAKVARIRSEILPEKLAEGEGLDQLRALLEPILEDQQECPSKSQLKEMDHLCAALEVLWLWRLHRVRRDELLRLMITGTGGLGWTSPRPVRRHQDDLKARRGRQGARQTEPTDADPGRCLRLGAGLVPALARGS